MKLRKIKINRLFNGYVSIRSYIVDKAKKEQISLLLDCKGETMLLTPNDLDRGKNTINKYFYSKWGEDPYTLLDYKWNPTIQLKLI